MPPTTAGAIAARGVLRQARSALAALHALIGRQFAQGTAASRAPHRHCLHRLLADRHSACGAHDHVTRGVRNDVERLAHAGQGQ